VTEFVRAVALEDIRIRSGGTGRTVEAYAAVFNEPAEIADQDGHYLEVNDPAAFNRSIQHHGGRFPVIYNHGMTVAGTPSDRGSVPIGVSTEVRADKRGVLTVSEYGTSVLADEVLEQIRMGSVKAQSYGGRFLRSDPGRRPAEDSGPTPAASSARCAAWRSRCGSSALRRSPPSPVPRSPASAPSRCLARF
jgi:phage head maturation protease